MIDTWDSKGYTFKIIRPSCLDCGAVLPFFGPCEKCFSRPPVERESVFDGWNEPDFVPPPDTRKKNYVGPKLTRTTAREIKKLLAAGEMRQEDIASKFGVSKSTITNIKSGRQWASV